MDLFANLTQFILSQESAFVAGVIAAFTPCILAIIPVFLYRFGIWNAKQDTKPGLGKVLRELGLFILGFFVSFIATGLLLNQLTNSAYVNATRLTLSFILILAAILQLFHRLNIYVFSRFTNPLLLGLVTPFVVSLSPCVLPYFTLILADSNVLTILPKFILFGAGILTPPIVIALIGKFALNLFRKSSKVLAKIEAWSPLLILLSGLYLGSQLIEVTQQDVIIATVITLVAIILSLLNTFKVPEQRTYQNIRNFTIVIVFWLAISVSLLTIAPQKSILTHGNLITYCVMNDIENTCIACTQAETLYILLAIALGLTIVRSGKKGKQLQLSY